MDEPTQISFEHKFDKVNKEFLQQIESIREVLPLIMIFASANEEQTNKDFLDYVKKKGKEQKNEKGDIFFTFTPEDSHNVDALEKNASIASTSVKIIPNSLFVSLISQFDSFLGNLIREIFNVKPEILNSIEKNIAFSKLLELKNLEEAKALMIEKEVESILRESHTDHFDWLENKLKIPLRKDLPIWQTYIEITERRNLFVHCDGVVSSQYLTNCRSHKVTFDNEPDLGSKLFVSPEYFESAYKCLYEVSAKLTQVIWRKLISNDLKNADESLNDICFELIKNRQFDLANTLLDFATRILTKHFNEESKNVFIINKALSYKLDGNKEKAKEIILTKDWSASNNKFKIAKEILLENFDEALILMKQMGANGEISKLNYKVWPLFLEFRKTNGFVKTYKEIFQEEYSLLETPKKLLDRIREGIASSKKEKQYLNIASFLEIAKPVFPNYQFIIYRAEGFAKLILKSYSNFSRDQFQSALKNNIDQVKQYNQHVIKITPVQYLNPYTMIRHCLYLYDKSKFKEMLFDVQRENFEKWMSESKTTY